jgi:hypothetical protein
MTDTTVARWRLPVFVSISNIRGPCICGPGMHGLKLLDHFRHEKFFFNPIGAGLSTMAFVVPGARGFSAAGDFVFRIVAAVSALLQTKSAALTGLIVVLPGVVGMLCRGRLAAIARINPVKVLIAGLWVLAEGVTTLSHRSPQAGCANCKSLPAR